jgi:hypothetical protein
LEEQRKLFVQYRNFIIILKEHIISLLRYKQEYWKKQHTLRWTKFGNENKKNSMLQAQRDIGIIPSQV